MKMRTASALVALVSSAVILGAPALADPEPKTRLVTLDGKNVDVLQLRHDFNSTWVVDTRNILYRDDSRDYYLVTLKEDCPPLSVRHQRFYFNPEPDWRVRASTRYEIRPRAGRPCDVAKIAVISDERAIPMRNTALWRMW